MKNCKSLASASKQKGFSLLTGFLLIIILFGALAFFLAGRGINTGFGTTYANSSKVSNLLAQAAYLRTGFDSVILAGTTPASVTFDDAITTGIFNLDTGGATKQYVDPAILVDTVGTSTGYNYWVYANNNASISGVGSPSKSDYTIMVGGIKQSICQQLNATVNGVSIGAPIPIFSASDVLVFGAAATSAAPTVGVLGATYDVPTAGLGAPTGCYQIGTVGTYVFIHAVYPQ